MKRIYGFKQRRWYGLKRGEGAYSDILSVLFSYDDPPTKEAFYGSSIEPNSLDHVVELKLVTKKIVE